MKDSSFNNRVNILTVKVPVPVPEIKRSAYALDATATTPING